MDHIIFLGMRRDALSTVRALPVRKTLIAEDRSARFEQAFDALLTVREEAPVDEWCAAVNAALAGHPPALIIGIEDKLQVTAVEVARRLHLPTPNAAAIALLQHKLHMRARLRAHGLDGTEAAEVHTDEQLLAFGARAGYPLILKPLDGRGSIGITKIDTPEHATASLSAFRQAHPGFRPLAEQFIEGQEYSVEAFTHGGRHTVLAVTEKFKDPRTYVETGHLLPARLDAATHATITSFVDQALTALQVESGPTHTELMLRGGQPVMIESHARPGGDELPALLRLSTGVDVLADWFDLLLPSRPPAAFPRPGTPGAPSGIAFLTPPATGHLRAVHGLDAVERLPGFREARLYKDVGAPVVHRADSYGRVGHVLFQHEDRAVIARGIQLVSELTDVHVS